MELHQVHFRLLPGEMPKIKCLEAVRRHWWGVGDGKKKRGLGRRLAPCRHFLSLKSDFFPVADAEVFPDAQAGLRLVQRVEVQAWRAGLQ